MAGWLHPVPSYTEWNPGSYMPQHTKHSGAHWAIDIYATLGSPILTPVNGKVMAAGSGKRAGNYVRIQGDDGVVYYYAHMDLPSNVAAGDQVTAGTRIGSVGDSGNAKGTTPHLHFSMKRDGNPVNPTQWLQGGELAPPPLDPVDEESSYTAEPFKGYTSRNLMSYLGFDITGQTADAVLNPTSLQPGGMTNIFGREMTQAEGDVPSLADELVAEEVPLTDPTQGIMDMDRFMAGIRYTETGSRDGNYTDRNARSGAYGAYQFLERYWKDFVKQATPYWAGREGVADWSWGNINNRTVQDQVARGVYEHFLKQYEGNWNLVATAWHAGPGTVRKIREKAGGKAWADITVADIEAGHPGEQRYIDKVFGRVTHG